MWKTFEEFPDYEVSDSGEVREKISRTLVKKYELRRGEYFVRVQKNGDYYLRAVGRAVANTYIPNPNHCRFVRHIDNNLKNDNVNNLKWIKSSVTPRPVIRIDAETGERKYYPNIKQAEKDGYARSQISKCCWGDRAFHRGYKWEWGDE